MALLLGLTNAPETGQKPLPAGETSSAGRKQAPGGGLPPGGKKTPPGETEQPPGSLQFSAVPRTNVLREAVRQPLADAKQPAVALQPKTKQAVNALKLISQLHKTSGDPASQATPTNTAGSSGAALNAPPVSTPGPVSVAAPGAPVPTDTPGLAGGVAARVQWMLNAQQPLARIALSPAHLGPIEVNVQVDEGGKTRIAITAHHDAARDALQMATPRLRELLGDSGLNLVQVSVGQQDTGSGGQSQDHSQRQRSRPDAGLATIDAVSATSGAVNAAIQGMVDDYA